MVIIILKVAMNTFLHSVNINKQERNNPNQKGDFFKLTAYRLSFLFRLCVFLLLFYDD